MLPYEVALPNEEPLTRGANPEQCTTEKNSGEYYLINLFGHGLKKFQVVTAASQDQQDKFIYLSSFFFELPQFVANAILYSFL